MRAGLAAAVLAALAVAAPAAAQPSGAEVLRGAIETLNRSHGPSVTDYGFTLVHEGVRTPVYVERGEEEWTVHRPDDSVMGELMGMSVLWPELIAVGESPGELDGLEEARYLGAESVEGRRAHVVAAPMGAEFGVENVDSLSAYVDAQNSHLLRIRVAGTMPEEGGQFAGGDMRLSIDMLDHRETDGVLMPRRVRLRMALKVPEMDAVERAQMTMGIALLQSQLQGSDDPEAREMLAMMQMFSTLLDGGEMDIPMTVEDVVVNAGPPAWLEEQ